MSATRRRTHRKAYQPSCESLEGRQLLNGTPQSLHIGTVDDSLTYGTTLGDATNPTTVLDANGNAVPGNFDYTDGSNDVTDTALNVGHYDLSVTFNPTDTADYNSVTTTASIDITKAQLQITAANATKLYGQDNPVLTSEISISQGTGWVDTGQSWTADTTATTNSAVGGYAIHPTGITDLAFLTNYDVSYVNGELTITRATPVITWALPTDITYGTALGATQLDATASVPGTFTYTPAAGTVLIAGPGQALSATFTPTDGTDYGSVTTGVAINVSKATPVLTWSNPAGIVHGVPLSTTQLDATASVPGTFTYTPAAGTVLNAGAGQALSATFTPTDTLNFNTAPATARINVAQAPPVSRAVVYDRAFVTSLYRDILGRGPDPAGLTSWVTRLLTGTSTDRVAQEFWGSNEHGLLLRQHRAPKISYFAALNDSLWAAQHAVSVLPVTPTPYQRDIAFVATLYRDILGRDPDPAGLTFWVTRLLTGTSTDRVAQEIWGSNEHRLLLRQHWAPKISYYAALADSLQAARTP